MEKRGKDIRELSSEIIAKAVFVIGDHEGLPDKEIKRLKNRISIGKPTYFASQTITIINNEIDRRIFT